MTHRTPAFVATMWAVVLLACSCDRRPTRSDDAVDDQTDAPALPAPVVEPVEAVDSAGEEPETARPRSPTPSLVGSDYVPDDDPENGGPEGFPLTRARDPADPTDARKRPFTIEALYQLKGIGAPTWAPDGLHIAFTVTSYDLQRGEQNQDVYVIAADGTGLRRMTQGSAQDGDPQWSPDGKSLLFRADRGDVPQLYRMAVDGGEAERVTDVPTGVDTPRWVPGGDRVLFVSRVFPEFGADMSAQRSALEDRERSPIRAHLADELLFRHWTQYDDGRVQHIFSHAASDGGVVDLTPGAFEAPAFSLDDDGLAISPDGRELAFVSNRDPGSTRAWTTNRDVFVVSIAPGTKYEAINLTDSNEAHDGLPSYSPDGKWIAFLRQEIPGFEADRFRLAVHDRETGEQRILTEGFDYWVTDLRWAPDSRSIVFQADVEGRTPLFTVALETGEIEKLALPSVHGFDVASTGALAFTFSRVGEPIELYTADADGAKPKRITALNQAVADEYDVRPAEELWIPAKDGAKIHTFVVKPHGYAKGQRYPLILNVHGGPQQQWVDSMRGDWQVYPGAGYVVAFANPRGSTGYGQAFTAAISKDWGGAVHDDLMAVTEHLAGLDYVDPERIGAMGWSFGGYMMNWFLGHTDRFAALASMMGIYELRSFYGATEELWYPEYDLGGPAWAQRAEYDQRSPSSYADHFQTPTLVLTGERDYRVPYTQSLQLFTALRRQGVPSRLIVFEDDGHWPSHVRSMPLYYAAHLDWFHRHLGGGPSPYDLEAMVRGRAFAGR